MSLFHAIALIFGAATLVGQTNLDLSQAFGDHRPRLPAGLGAAVACGLADFNGDGLPDLVRADASQVTVLMQDAATGVFAPAVGQVPLTFSFLGQITALAIGNFAGGLRPDIVVGFEGGADQLLISDAAGRFTRSGALPHAGQMATTDLVVADVDASGSDDLLILVRNAAPRLLICDGLGGFSDQSSRLPIAAMRAHSAAGIIDVDADGDTDLLLFPIAAAAPIILRNNGSGSFLGSSITLPRVAGPAHSIWGADVTSDRRDDVVIQPVSNTSVRPVVLRNQGGGQFAMVAPTGAFSSRGVEDLALADVNGDGSLDLVVTQSDGVVLVGTNHGSGTFGASTRILDTGARGGLCCADLDLDGDVDCYIPGATSADAMLISDGLGSFFDSEAPTLPDRPMSVPYSVVIVDASGDQDPDLGLVASTGNAWLLRSDGGTRYGLGPNGVFPVLPSGGVFRATQRVALGVSQRDLIVAGQPSGASPSGIRVLSWANGIYSDVSATAWPVSGLRNTALVVGDLGGGANLSGIGADVVVADSSPQLRLFRANSSRFQEIAGAFVGRSFNAYSDLLIGDLNHDQRNDVVALTVTSTPQVYLATSSASLSRAPGAVPALGGASAGVLADLTGDGDLDLLVVASQRPAGFVFYRGTGTGGFVDDTAAWFPGLRFPGLVAVAAVGVTRQARVVFGRSAGEDFVVSRMGSYYAGRRVLPVRGSRATADFVVGDLDLDGDEDLVVVRAGSLPLVLFNLDRQLTASGIAQVGRQMQVRIDSFAGDTAFLWLSPFRARLAFPRYGVLRLLFPISLHQAVVPASGLLRFQVPLPVTLQAGDLPMQSAIVGVAGTVLLGNLEFARVTDF